MEDKVEDTGDKVQYVDEKVQVDWWQPPVPSNALYFLDTQEVRVVAK